MWTARPQNWTIILSPDGKTLYFSRRNLKERTSGGIEDKEDIWYSGWARDGKWQLAKNMGPSSIHFYFISGINSATPDGKSVVMILGNKYEQWQDAGPGFDYW